MARLLLRYLVPQILQEARRPMTPRQIAEALQKRGYGADRPRDRLSSSVREWVSRYAPAHGIKRVGYGLYEADGSKARPVWVSAAEPARVEGRPAKGPRVEVTPAALERAQRDLVLKMPADLSSLAQLLLELAQACLAGYAALRANVHDDEREETQNGSEDLG